MIFADRLLPVLAEAGELFADEGGFAHAAVGEDLVAADELFAAPVLGHVRDERVGAVAVFVADVAAHQLGQVAADTGVEVFGQIAADEAGAVGHLRVQEDVGGFDGAGGEDEDLGLDVLVGAGDGVVVMNVGGAAFLHFHAAGAGVGDQRQAAGFFRGFDEDAEGIELRTRVATEPAGAAVVAGGTAVVVLGEDCLRHGDHLQAAGHAAADFGEFEFGGFGFEGWESVIEREGAEGFAGAGDAD